MALFVAFYSYKGGVGRSLALANVAHSLAARGKRVVLLDLDLEAPGLQEIPVFSFKGGGAKKGFLEYAASYRRTGACPEISRYVHPCRESPGLGRLWIMPSGALGSTYQDQLGSLSWKRLHSKKGTEPFVEELRSSLVREFAPHYVLIDSRTGLSDIGGLTTHRLADMVVLVFNLTRPSIEGSVRAYRSFTAEGSRVQTVQLVASPVPPIVPGAGSIVERRLQQAAELMPIGTSFGRALIRIDYDLAMVLSEELAVQNPDTFAAATRYEALRESLQRANPEEVFPLVEEAQALRSEGRLEEGLSLLLSFTEAHPENAEGFLELGNFFFEASRTGEAVKAFQRSSSLAPNLSLASRRLGEALVKAERVEEAIEALEKAEAAGEKNRELYQALAEAYEIKKEPSKEIEARRKAMLALLGTPRKSEAISSLPPSDTLKKEFAEVLSRRPPYPGFQAEIFLDGVLQSLNMPIAAKAEILKQVLSGDMKPGRISSLLRALREEDTRWNEILGPEARHLKQLIANKGIDPFDADAVLSLRQENQVESAVVGFVALDENLPIERRIALLEESISQGHDDPALRGIFGQILREASDKSDENYRQNLLERAVEQFSQATEVTATYALLFQWGIALSDLAGLTEADQKRSLLSEAAAKYQQALQSKPDQHDALLNWGTALGQLADLAEADRKLSLLQEAAEKFQQVLQIRPDQHEALHNWGIALSRLAELADADQKHSLLQQSAEKFQQALQIKPDKHETLNNWGATLGKLAELTEADRKRSLLQEAAEKVQQALQIKPDKHEAFFNWGAILGNLAELAETDQKRYLLQQAAEKFQQTLQIKPDQHEALSALGTALAQLAELAEADQKCSLLQQATEKLQQALQIKPDQYEDLSALGTALAQLATLAETDQKESLLQQATEKFRQALQIKPDKYEPLYNWGAILSQLATLAENDRKRPLLQEAAEKYQQVLQIKPDEHEALDNWGTTLSQLATLAETDQKRSLLQEATSKYQHALHIRPKDPEILNNLSANLLRLAGLEEGEPLQPLATKAAELARQANELQPRSADYNLACALSRLGQFDEAAKLLKEYLQNKPGLPSHFREDPDLQPLWAARPDFKAEIEQSSTAIPKDASEA